VSNGTVKDPIGSTPQALSEEEARRIDVTLARCADGSPRRDLRVALD
jgi:hypothetical protein